MAVEWILDEVRDSVQGSVHVGDEGVCCVPRQVSFDRCVSSAWRQGPQERAWRRVVARKGCALALAEPQRIVVASGRPVREVPEADAAEPDPGGWTPEHDSEGLLRGQRRGARDAAAHFATAAGSQAGKQRLRYRRGLWRPPEVSGLALRAEAVVSVEE